MAGPDPQDPASLMLDCSDCSDALSGDVSGLKVGICRDHFFEGIVPEVAYAV